VEMDIRERLIICADGRAKQPFPETAALGPTCLQVSALLNGDAIDLGHSHLNDGRRYRGGHAENQIERARHRAADRPCVHQDLANEGHRATGVPQARAFREQKIDTTLACALPPLGTLKVQVDKEHRASPRALACAGVHLSPQRRERRVVVGLLGQTRHATRIQLAHRGQGILVRPTLRLDRRSQYFLLLSHGRFVSLKSGREFSILPLGLRCGVSRYLQ
jgi:hypothetical protein